jgi:hypothetical protein
MDSDQLNITFFDTFSRHIGTPISSLYPFYSGTYHLYS